MSNGGGASGAYIAQWIISVARTCRPSRRTFVPWPMSGRARRDRLAHAHRDPPAMLDSFDCLINEVAMRDFESSLYEMRVEHTVVFVDLGAQEDGPGRTRLLRLVR